MICLPLCDLSRIEIKTKGCRFEKFLECELYYKDDFGNEKKLDEDYLYIFVENTLNRIKNIPSLDAHPEMFGQMGKWQEFYYYSQDFCDTHKTEIDMMNKALWISTEKYGLFLYSYNNELWFEMDHGYDSNFSCAKKYYDRPENYRVALNKIKHENVEIWKKTIEEVQQTMAGHGDGEFVSGTQGRRIRLRQRDAYN